MFRNYSVERGVCVGGGNSGLLCYTANFLSRSSKVALYVSERTSELVIAGLSIDSCSSFRRSGKAAAQRFQLSLSAVVTWEIQKDNSI